MNDLDNRPNQQFPRIPEVFIILATTFSLTILVALAGALFLRATELLLTEIVIILPSLLYVRLRKKSFREIFRLNYPGHGVLLSSLLISIGTIILVDELDRITQIVFPLPELWAERLQDIYEILTIYSIQDALVIVISAVFFAGLFEEMLFRGLVQQSFEKHINVAQAIIYSAIVFAFIHMNPWQMLQITVLGIVLGFLSWRSNSIFPGAILHGLNNGLAVLFLNLGETKTAWYVSGDHVKWFWLLLAAAMAYLGFRLFIHFTGKASSDEAGAHQVI